MEPQRPTHEQFAQLLPRIGRQLRVLGKLRDRLQRRGYVPSDPYFISVTQAYNAVHALHVATHYNSCASGVGQPLPPADDTPTWLKAIDPGNQPPH